MKHLAINDLRNITEASVELHPGLNVFCGRNAQGKTSLLEAVGFAARGRSFRTEDVASMIRRGGTGLRTRAETGEDGRVASLEVQLSNGRKRFRVDGRDVMPRDYRGRLEAVVYSTERLKVVRGSMRDRRQFLDRSAAALWPAYRADARSFERVLTQRNAALRDRARDLPVWTESFIDAGARLRQRRGDYAHRLSQALGDGFSPAGEAYAVRTVPPSGETLDAARAQLAAELRELAHRERAAARSLAGPHRDKVELLLDGRDAAVEASSGQARSLLLALVLVTLDTYRAETGRSAVALLDDLDSELDHERALHLCTDVAARAQTLVTTTHSGWAESLRSSGQLFHVSQGEVHCA